MKIQGIVTYERSTQKGTMIKVGRRNAYIPQVFQNSLIGVRIALEGQWIEKKRKYLYAEKFWILHPFDEEEKKKAYQKVEKFSRKNKIKIPLHFQIEPGKEILTLLAQIGHMKVIKKILLLPKKSQIKILHNPYLLYTKKYSDFYTADIIARMVPTIRKKEKIYPFTLYILETVYENKRESLDLKELVEILNRYLEGITEEDVRNNIPSGGRVKIEGDKVYLSYIYWCKRYVMNSILNANKDFDSPYRCGDPEVDKILQYRYSAIIGPAGSGKTTILRKVADSYPGEVVLSALTGKAAKVLSKSARTVHDLLGFSRIQKGKFSKKYINGLLIVDEASMMNWVTAYAIFRSAKKVLLAGDPNQLPPVHGESVFKQILKLIPVLELQKVYRQNNHKIEVIKRNNYSSMLSTTRAIAKVLHNQKKQFQIITPLVETAHDLNMNIKKILNHKHTFSSGDKIMVIKNIYVDGLMVASNGDVGYIIKKEDDEFYRVRIGKEKETVMLKENEMELAYAITVHKAQGSEYDYVIFVIPPGVREDFIEETRYVGETRGKEKTYILTTCE